MNNSAFTDFLDIRREEAWRISVGNLFQRQVTITKKAQFLVIAFWPSLGVASFSIMDGEEQVKQVLYLISERNV